MYLIICGGRDYVFTDDDLERLDGLKSLINVNLIISGCATGADQEGEIWARDQGIPVQHFKPDWEAYGRSAGPRRNTEMAEYVAHNDPEGGALVAFPGDASDMLRKAKSKGLRIFDWRSFGDD